MHRLRDPLGVRDTCAGNEWGLAGIVRVRFQDTPNLLYVTDTRWNHSKPPPRWEVRARDLAIEVSAVLAILAHGSHDGPDELIRGEDLRLAQRGEARLRNGTG